MRRLATALCLGVAAQVAAVGARAETRALLVGVSDYDAEGAGIADLRGPANDVRLLRDVLKAQGVRRIDSLADGVEGAGRPSRAAILAALAGLAAASGKGDLVYLHFSGHGTRQIDRNGDETDGLDEVFLAIDAGPGAPGSGLIANAVTDDEIGSAVAAIRAAGADVWVVLDFCNSGTGLRGVSPGIAARFVDPAAFGIDAPPDGVPEAGDEIPAGEGLPGGFLAFYAARSSEIAHEVNLAGAEGGNAWYGLFTAKLAARLEGVPAMSYRQLFQAVLADFNDESLPGPARLQTPSWEGTLIDRGVFGQPGQPGAAPHRFRVAGGELRAGIVHGLGPGVLMALVADAAAPEGAIIGFAQIERAEPLRAVLRPVDAGCTPRRGGLCPPLGAMPREAAFAQVAGRPIDLTVGLAPALDAASGAALAADAPSAVALRAALGEAAAAGHALRLDAEGYSVETLWADGRLWFGPRAAVGGRPVGLGWDPSGAAPLAPLLVRIAEAESLARMLGAVAGEASPLNPDPVAISAELSPVSADDLARPGQTVAPARECAEARAGAAAGAAAAIALPVAAEVKQCDRLGFSGRGRVAGAWDVNRVYIDSRYCIRVDHTLIEGVARPAPLGPAMTVCSDCPDGYAAGIERAFMIVTEAREAAEPVNLEGILDNCQPTGPLRGALAGPLRDLLAARARRPDIRGGPGAFAVSDIWVEGFSWQVLPREEVFRRNAALGPVSNDDSR